MNASKVPLWRVVLAAAAIAVLPGAACASSLIKLDLARVNTVGVVVHNVVISGETSGTARAASEALKVTVEEQLTAAGLTLAGGQGVRAWFSIVATTHELGDSSGLLLTEVRVSLSHRVAWPETGCTELRQQALIWWHFSSFVGTASQLDNNFSKRALSVLNDFLEERAAALRYSGPR